MWLLLPLSKQNDTLNQTGYPGRRLVGLGAAIQVSHIWEIFSL